MNFSYHFPAVKGIQAGREYYISMVPLKLLSRLFPAEDEIVLPEHRAQRRINETRIPEIKNYILDNRDTYVFSALSASIDGEFKFTPYMDTDVGLFEVDMESIFLINIININIKLMDYKMTTYYTISTINFKELKNTKTKNS